MWLNSEYFTKMKRYLSISLNICWSLLISQKKDSAFWIGLCIIRAISKNEWTVIFPSLNMVASSCLLTKNLFHLRVWVNVYKDIEQTTVFNKYLYNLVIKIMELSNIAQNHQ
jgi:hypothetical protein